MIEKTLLFVIGLLILLLPINISFIKERKIVKEKTLHVQVLYDVSLSMTADDIQPSRFNAAKNSLIALVSNLEGYNISIITFSGIPFIWSPFSDESTAVISKLNQMKISDFPPTVDFVGTAIGDAILLGIKNLQNNSSQTKSPGIIILLTDGDSNRGSEPIQAAKISANNGIPIYTLAIGKKEYVVGNDYYNTPVTTKINIPLLQEISKTSGGTFYRVLADKQFTEIFDKIAKLVKSDEKQKIINEYENLNKYFSSALIILLFLYLGIRIYIIVGINKKGFIK